MLILLIVGVALVVFGALLLLKFPDRPGGRVALGKIEVSSQGAGLPLVVVGVACLFFAAQGAGNGGGGNDGGKGGRTPSPTPAAATPTPSQTPADDLLGRRFAPAACGPDPKGQNFSAVSTPVQLGVSDRTIWTGGVAPRDVRLRLFDGDDFVGVIDLTLHAEGGRSSLFRVRAVLDRDCRTVTHFENASRGGDPRVLQNWDRLRFAAGGATYEVRLGFDPASGVKIQSFTKTHDHEYQR